MVKPLLTWVKISAALQKIQAICKSSRIIMTQKITSRFFEGLLNRKLT